MFSSLYMFIHETLLWLVWLDSQRKKLQVQLKTVPSANPGLSMYLEKHQASIPMGLGG